MIPRSQKAPRADRRHRSVHDRSPFPMGIRVGIPDESRPIPTIATPGAIRDREWAVASASCGRGWPVQEDVQWNAGSLNDPHRRVLTHPIQQPPWLLRLASRRIMDWLWDWFVGYTRASRRGCQGRRIDQAKEPSNACDSHGLKPTTKNQQLWRRPFLDWKMPVVNRIQRWPS